MRRGILAAVPALILLAGALFAPAAMAADGGGHGYDSIPKPLPGNLPSWSFEATQTSEFGNEITFADAPQAMQLGQVVVTLSSWACQQGTWTGGDCVTEPGAEFSWPITFNVYNPPATGTSTPGVLIATETDTFSIPYRPSASPKCTGGKWYSDRSQSCFNGLATTIKFNFNDPHVTLPTTVVYGIAYNTSDYGAVPQRPQPCNATTAGCPYDSLNVALSTDSTDLSAGSDPNTGAVFMNTSYAPDYCDGGTTGVGIFRLDSPNNGCWQVLPNTVVNSLPAYIPAVQFK
jgi:hypothetical protein